MIKPERIAILGPKDSYSYLAASGYFKDGAILVEYPTITGAIMGVYGGCDAAFVPYENSSEGTVSDTVDALIENDLYISLEYDLKIDNRLLFLKGADINKIKKIYTHRQPYGQCRRNIAARFRAAEIIFCDSTSAAAAMVSDETSAAIGGIQLLSGGVRLAASDFSMNDQRDNRTRFILVSKNESNDPLCDRSTVVFEGENKPGGLVSLLSIFDKRSINLTKIESRPRKDIIGRYLFIVDFNGGARDPRISGALKELSEKTVFYKFLGSYRIG